MVYNLVQKVGYPPNHSLFLLRFAINKRSYKDDKTKATRICAYPVGCSFSIWNFIPNIPMAYGRSRASSVLDGFTLNPLPYPVLLILAVIFIFLGISWYFSYEEVVETAEEQLGWILFVTPVVLLLIVRWLSSMDNSDWFFASSPWDRRRSTHHRPSEGSSPWGVAALIVLLLILVQYQSTFLDSWFG